MEDNNIPRELHNWTRSELLEAKHEFTHLITSYFGEVWDIKSDGEYKGCIWDCMSPLLTPMGLWLLCMRVKHKGAVRAAGRMESHNVGTIVRFTLLYEPVGIIVPGVIH